MVSIEEVGLFHFHPGASVLIASASSNPEQSAAEAERSGASCIDLSTCHAVSEVVRVCRQRGLRVVLTIDSQGLVTQSRLGADALNVRLWVGFDLDRSASALAGLRQLAEGPTWFEIEAVLSAGDTDRDIDAFTLALHKHLGGDVPVHFSTDARHSWGPGWPLATALRHSRWIAMANGLHWVYTALGLDTEGQDSLCPGCDALLLRRSGGEKVETSGVRDGRCAVCGWELPGRLAVLTAVHRPRPLRREIEMTGLASVRH